MALRALQAFGGISYITSDTASLTLCHTEVGCSYQVESSFACKTLCGISSITCTTVSSACCTILVGQIVTKKTLGADSCWGTSFTTKLTGNTITSRKEKSWVTLCTGVRIRAGLAARPAADGITINQSYSTL